MQDKKCPETKAIILNEIIDRRVMSKLQAKHKEMYWDVIKDLHEICEGFHYNEDFAIWEVSQMMHEDKKGEVHKGEHWTIEQVKAVYEKHKPKLKPTVTCWDFYVAMHSWWHDNICADMSDYGAEHAEAKNIERGIMYFFGDDDAPSGKIWRYYRGMHKLLMD